MRVRPGVPLDGNAITGGDRGVAASCGGCLVADDVAVSEGVRLDEAVVRIGGSPAYNSGRVGHIGEGGRVISLVRDTIDDNVANVSMGGNTGGTGQSRDE